MPTSGGPGASASKVTTKPVPALSATSFGHTGRLYSRLEEDELPSSPPRTRKGLPSTISCVAAPCLRRCGSEDGCATQTGPAKTQTAAKTIIQCWRKSLFVMTFENLFQQ